MADCFYHGQSAPGPCLECERTETKCPKCGNIDAEAALKFRCRDEHCAMYAPFPPSQSK